VIKSLNLYEARTPVCTSGSAFWNSSEREILVLSVLLITS